MALEEPLLVRTVTAFPSPFFSRRLFLRLFLVLCFLYAYLDATPEIFLALLPGKRALKPRSNC